MSDNIEDLDPAGNMTVHVLRDVLLERKRQNEKWGINNYPDVPDNYGIQSADDARKECEISYALGSCTWAHVAMEEFAEAVEAATSFKTTGNVDEEFHLREELVQTAAVIVAWIEAIDRRSKDRQNLCTPQTEK